jgi:hypothetical protein
MAGDIVTSTNQQLLGYFKGVNFLNIVGWFVFAILLIGGAFYFMMYYRNRKIYSKKVTAFDQVGIYFEPAIRDLAKVVKLGSGGFEILYLKKLKTWKIAFGGRVGKNTYYFFIMPDGYWYNGMLSANVFKINELGGLIPIVTTNPSMRTQYTALEKQINDLHAKKQTFWDKYGQWVLALGFVLVAGLMLWLNYQQFVKATSMLSTAMDKAGQLLDTINKISSNTQASTSGLTPLK